MSVVNTRRAIDDKSRLCIAAQAVFQQPRQLAVSIGYMFLFNRVVKLLEIFEYNEAPFWQPMHE